MLVMYQGILQGLVTKDLVGRHRGMVRGLSPREGAF